MEFPTIHIDDIAMINFLVGLLNTPSPTGFTGEGMAYVRRAFEALNIAGLSFSYTNKGALVAIYKGRSEQFSRAATAHIDTFGLMVKEIKSNGRLKVTQLGSYSWKAIEFEGVTVHTQDNRRFRGTIVPVNASFHVNRTLDEMERNENTLEVRLDLCVDNAHQTHQSGIEVGDFISLDPRVEVTETGFIRSPCWLPMSSRVRLGGRNRSISAQLGKRAPYGLSTLS